MSLVSATQLKSFPMLTKGKVRDVYDLNRQLLLVATDRISAFDVVFTEPIPDKGRVLTGLSVYWFNRTKDVLPNHLITVDMAQVPGINVSEREMLTGRSMLVKKGDVVPVECVVRGYLAGSGWKEYRQAGSINGIKLPGGLVESVRLPEPIFTPSTKETVGHDLPLTFDQLLQKVGKQTAEQLREYSLKLYQIAAKQAEANGIIIADTKFEFAWIDGNLTVIDEIFTPDSSRFWPLSDYRPGQTQPSFDKQYLRDYLETLDWNKQPPAPTLPPEVIRRTSEKYRDAYRRITGGELV